MKWLFWALFAFCSISSVVSAASYLSYLKKKKDLALFKDTCAQTHRRMKEDQNRRE